MPSIDTQHLFLLFIFYSFAGWIGEEIWVSVLYRKIEKRGMLHGPLCPIYGFGALIILFAIYPWRNTWLRLFVASAVLASILEYFSSWLLEMIFHTKWWDYSGHKFNLNGRVCLLNSCAFGAGGVAFGHFLHPLASDLVFSSGIQPFVPAAYYIFSTILGIDVLFTVKRLVRFSETMEKLKMLGEQLMEKYGSEPWFRDADLHAMIHSVKARIESGSIQANERLRQRLEKFSKRQRNEERLFRKFPTMSSREYRLPLDHIKQTFRESLESKKAQKLQAAKKAENQH
ncbi:putative ABC transporter permease [Treponema sp.]|uniref:putative ABC transporter permease n=1 Tax=Treponema sp. TaxID=166 RepID=UPI003F022ED7